LHLDLFEVIKSAITSTQNGGAITDVDMGEPDREVTTTSTEAEGEMAAVKVDTPSNYFWTSPSFGCCCGFSIAP